MSKGKLEVVQGPADLEGLRSELESFKADTAEHLSNISKELQEQTMKETRYLKKVARDGIHDGMDTLNESLDGLQSYSEQKLKKLEKNVKAKPLQSLATAFAVGMIASIFLGRRS